MKFPILARSCDTTVWLPLKKIMGLELQKAFKMETRKLAWLIGLVFVTVILFQYVEVPKGISLFLRAKNPDQKTNSFFSDNMTSPSIVLVLNTPHQLTLGLENDTSNNISSFVFNRDFTPSVAPAQPPFKESEIENTTTPPGRNWDFTPSVAPAQPPFVRSEIENTATPPGQNWDFTSSPAPSPQAVVISSSAATKKEDRALPPVVSHIVSAPTIKTSTVLKHDLLSPPPVVVHRQVTKSKPIPEVTPKEVYTLSDMNEMFIQSQMLPTSMMPRWPMKVDEQLMHARLEIENAPAFIKDGLYAPLYRNASMFQRSYELMEQILKVYIYREGDRPVFHKPPLEGIYASEGWFMKLLEENRQFVTRQPKEAHLFYLPFSSRNLEAALYVPNSHSHRNLVLHLKGYVDMIAAIYPFWNRTYGADHFLVACHDWAPSETKRIMGNCIRALCNADVKEGFKFGKDVSLPETYVRKAADPARGAGGRAVSKRKTLAFFAGSMHGYLRPILLQHWGNKKDPDMQIFAQLPRSKGNRNYIDYMKSSKYCICAKGYEVNSPRVVEAIFYECVPVIISDNFVPPFFETLNWESFAVFVMEKDIPNLKNILVSIPHKTYLRMQMRVRKVQRHFLWHPTPVKYDLFHMILHSIWYNRVFQFRPR